jgi:PAS domain S-box-containing protein
MKRFWHRLLGSIVAGALAALCSIQTGIVLAQTAAPAKPQAAQKSTLILYSYGYGSKGIEIFTDSFRSVMNEAGVSVSQMFFEYLDLERNRADPEFRPKMLAMLQKKYAARQIDLIITVQQPALDFLVHEGREIAPGAPAITLQAPTPKVADTAGRRIVSQVTDFDIRGTLERALDLFPETRRVVFVSGSSDADRKMAAAAADIAALWQDKLAFEFTAEISLDAMLKRVASLPPNTIIIFTQYNRDVSGSVTVAYEVERMIVKAANAPVFGLYDFNLYSGGIGGSVVGVKNLGARTGRIALNLLGGDMQLSDQVTVVRNDVVPTFDWGQIARWGGDPGQLPANTVFVNRTPTFLEQYRVYAIAAGVFFLAQSWMIVVLLLSRRRRKRAEQALQESETSLAITLHSIGDAVIATDQAGRVTRMNPTAERLSGWTLDEARDCDLAEVFRIINADTRETVANPVHLVMAHGKAVALANHTILQNRDGKEFQIADSAAPIRDGGGKIVGVVLVFSDITEQYRVEEALRASEARFRAVFDQAAVGVAQIESATGRFDQINQRYCDLLGYTPEEMLALDFQTITYADDLQADLDNMRSLIAGKIREFSMEKRYWRKDGSIVWVWLTVSRMVISGKNSRFHIAVVEDISERKRAEIALKESVDKFSKAFLATPESVTIASMEDGRYIEVNDVFLEITGFQRHEVIGRTSTELGFWIDTNDRQRFIDALTEAGSLRNFEVRFRMRNGAERVVLMSTEIIELQGKNCSLNFILDITERKQAEAQIRQTTEDLRQLNETLEARVTERTLELRNANSMLIASGVDLARSNEELEQFAYVASHDLQEPLRTVIGFVQLLEKRLANKLDKEGLEYMNYVVDGALRMRALIHDVLAYSRVGSQGEPPEQVDCAAAVHKALVALRSQIYSTGAEVEVMELPTVRVDRIQLVQLFQNLIGNAIKFCRDGVPRVRVEASREGALWRFSITDNGIGIAPEYRERIFGIFQRLHTRDDYDGTGIGLAICRRIVQHHGGQIGVDPAPGGGSAFWFTLPEESSK